MLRSTPYNLALIYEQGRKDALAGTVNEDLRWTWPQAAEYWEGWYSVKTRNGVIPARDALLSDLDLY